MGDHSNPYAPPETVEPAASQSHDWYVDLPAVFVRNGAVLPEICLETGRKLDLQRIPRKLILASFIDHFWLLPYLSILFAPESLKKKYRFTWDSPVGFLAIPIGVIILSLAGNLIKRRSSRHIRFECWISRPHHQARRKRKYIRTGLFALGIVMLLLGLIPGDAIPFDQSMALLIGSVVVLVTQAFWQYSDREKNQLTAGEKGWARIGNIHLEAIRFLRQIERERGG